MTKSKGFNLVAVVLIMIFTSIISAITVGVIITNSSKINNNNYNELLNDENVKEFLNVYNSILDDYYEDVDKTAMVESAINAMLNYLDDNYTTYMSPEEKQNLAERLSGTYQGIGVTVQKCKIIAVTPNSPAEEAGLKVDDVIIKINDKDFSTCDDGTNYLLAESIRENSNKTINVTVKRGEEERTVQVNVKELLYPLITSQMIEDTKIGYIGFSIFSSNITEQFVTAFNELKEQGLEKLIIDLRGNTGGYLEGARGIASLFIEKGKELFTLEGKDKKETFYDEDDASEQIPIVILINGASASASEILTGSLKDSYGATLIGTTSFGKGKVQQTYTLDDGSMAKYTTALWYRPNGECIDGVGIKPDIEVVNEETTDENGQTVIIDNSLPKAIEYFNTVN